MNTKHTPGPWKICEHRNGFSREVCAAADGIVAVANGTSLTEATTYENARLIAAAPELLAALVACLNDAPSLDHTKAGPIARAAIAKATA